MERSMDDLDPVAGCIYVVDLSFRIHRLLLLMKSSICFSLLSNALFPHSGLWALKSPRSRTGGVSWVTRSSRSRIFIGVLGGRKIEHKVIGLCNDILTATA